MVQVEELRGGATGFMATDLLYAGGMLPVWRDVRPSARWRLTVPVQEEGEYRIHFVARLDSNGPGLQVWWDGSPAILTTGGDMVDLYRADRTLLREFTLQTAHLTAGPHTLEFLYAGSAAGVGRPEVGLDFIWVQRVG
jgi:hypothetical protein